MLAGVLVLTMPPGRAQAQVGGPDARLVGAIDDVVGLFAQSLEQGNMKEARNLEGAVQDLMKALEHAEGMKRHHHHHHHHHKGGGAFGQGMTQTADSSGNQQDLGQPFTGGGKGQGSSSGQGTSSTSPSSSTSQGTSGQQGSFGKGTKHFGHHREEKHHHHHHEGSFGKGIAALSEGKGRIDQPLPGSSSTAAKTSAGGSSAKSSGSSRGALGTGMTTVTNNIRNDFFNGPTNINVNNGKQQLTQIAQAATAKNGKGGKSLASAKASTNLTAGTTGLKTATKTGAANGSGSSSGKTSTDTHAGQQVGSKGQTPAVAKNNGSRRTSSFTGATASAKASGTGNGKASALSSAKAKTGGTTTGATTMASTKGSGKATATAFTKSGNAFAGTQTKHKSSGATGVGSAHQQTAQIGKMTGNFKGATTSGAAKKSGYTPHSTAGTSAPRHVGSSVGSRPTSHAASAGGKRK
jgi:hypothetical protein